MELILRQLTLRVLRRRPAVLAARPDRERPGLVGRQVQGRAVRLLPGIPSRRAAQDRVQVSLATFRPLLNLGFCIMAPKAVPK